MAKISTRAPGASGIDDEMILGAAALIDKYSDGAIGIGPNSVRGPGDTPEEVLRTLDFVLDTMVQVINQFRLVSAQQSQHIQQLSYNNEEYARAIDRFLDVSYDDALDAAATDMFAAFDLAGHAEVSANSTLVFTEDTQLTQSDLKSVLRIAVDRWVDIKLAGN